MIDGEELIKLARDSITSYFENRNVETNKFKERKGVFVTLYQNSELRGCIGFIKPIGTLGENIINAARLAAFRDPRFPPLQENEKFRIEISVLTEPELISEKDHGKILKQIEIGRDGLIIEQDIYSGLLLPQVASEFNMDKEEFLEALCQKAGLPANAWKSGKCKLFKFQAQIFKEQHL